MKRNTSIKGKLGQEEEASNIDRKIELTRNRRSQTGESKLAVQNR